MSPRTCQAVTRPRCAPRVTGAMCFVHLVHGDMGVDFGRGDGDMTQEHLDAAQVRAASQQMGGERMPQRVRMQVQADPSRA